MKNALRKPGAQGNPPPAPPEEGSPRGERPSWRGLRGRWLRPSCRFVVALVLLLSLVAYTPQGRAETVGKVLDGMCYSPFRDGQGPTTWPPVYPTEAQVVEDLDSLGPLTVEIRTYGNDGVLYEIPRLCDERGIVCHPAAWIDSYLEANEESIARLINHAHAGYSTLGSVIVGNEAVVGGHVNAQQLIGYIDQVREATSLPVTTAEGWQTYRDYPEIAGAVDYIMIHVHPYWGGLPVHEAAYDVLHWWSEISQMYPDKEVVVGETGWPTSGDTWGQAVPSEENQTLFITNLIALARTHGMKVFYFGAYDEAWKAEFEGTSGAHWGLFNSDRTPKPVIATVAPRDNTPPVIEEHTPEDALLFVRSDETVRLDVSAHDPDGDPLAHEWSINEIPQADADASSWSFATTTNMIGPNLLSVEVDDGYGGVARADWQLLVGEGDPELVGYWSFEGSGADRSGWGHDLDIEGNHSYTWDGVAGSCLRFP